jgi:hypothetical protein
MLMCVCKGVCDGRLWPCHRRAARPAFPKRVLVRSLSPACVLFCRYSRPTYSQAALESRIVVGYVAGASVLALVAQASLATKAGQRLRARLFSIPHATNTPAAAPKEPYVAQHGGPMILSFQVTRFLANAALFALTLYTAVTEHGKSWGSTTLAMVAVRPVCSSGSSRSHAAMRRRTLSRFPSPSSSSPWPTRK